MFGIVQYFRLVVMNHNFLKLSFDQHHRETNHQIQYLISNIHFFNEEKSSLFLLLLSFKCINSIVARASSVGSCSRRVFCIKRLENQREKLIDCNPVIDLVPEKDRVKFL